MSKSTSQSGQKYSAGPQPVSISIPAELSVSQPGYTLRNQSTVDLELGTQLVIPDQCYAVLTQASFANSQPNVAAAGVMPGFPNGNNRISINWNGAGYAGADMLIPQGLYELSGVQDALNRIAYDNGWITDLSAALFLLSGTAATQKVTLTLNPAPLVGGVFPAGGIILNFTNPSPDTGLNDSMGDLLGFPTTGAGAILTIPGGGSNAVPFFAPNVADFAFTSAYKMYMSIVDQTLDSTSVGPLFYTFTLGANTPSNAVISVNPSLSLPIKLAAGSYKKITIYTTDQSGNLLPWAFYQSPFVFSFKIMKHGIDVVV